MSTVTKYELLERQYRNEKLIRCIKLIILALLCLVSIVALGLTWMVLHREALKYPDQLIKYPESLLKSRIANYAKLHGHHHSQGKHNDDDIVIAKPHLRIDGDDLSNRDDNKGKFRIVCYYNFPNKIELEDDSAAGVDSDELLPKDIDPNLCTHLNIGFIPIVNNSLDIAKNQKLYLSTQIQDLRKKNPDLKILFWVGGGAFDYGFIEMVKTHKSRKQFIQSVKYNLEKYLIDGVDLDWEFPSPYKKDRQHFSQLLHEIRREYQREHRTYLLTVAMPGPPPYQDILYDIDVINQNVDYVNVMAYDFNLYTPSTPFTGLNAPLYPSQMDHGVFTYMNINSSAYNLHNSGLDRSKIVIGLPTYGHTFRLVSPFNHHIHSPASGNGRLGALGFTTYSEVCWFQLNNFYVNTVYDEMSCSPYMYSLFEWISYENDQSIECKSRWIKDNRFGGAMVYSLNADDFNLYCFSDGAVDGAANTKSRDDFTFPLTRKVRSVLNP